MEIVPFEAKYQKSVLEMNEISLKQSEYIGKTVNAGWHDDLGKIKEAYLDGNGAFLLWLDNGKLTGMGGLLKVDATTAKIKRIRVHPDYQRRGLSGEIFAELEKKARQLGYCRLIADTAKGNMPAEKMLRKAGFLPIEEKYFDPVTSGPVLCVIFEKILD